MRQLLSIMMFVVFGACAATTSTSSGPAGYTMGYDHPHGELYPVLTDIVASQHRIAATRVTRDEFHIVCAPVARGDLQEVLYVRLTEQPGNRSSSVMSIEVTPYLFRFGHVVRDDEVPADSVEHAHELLAAIRTGMAKYAGPIDVTPQLDLDVERPAISMGPRRHKGVRL